MGCLKITYRQEPELKIVSSKKELTLKYSSEKVYRSYLYGFNGMEKDDEIKSSTGTSYDFGLRMYDPRLGKFFSPDPFERKFSDMSPYLFAGNSPIKFIDYNGGFRIPKDVADKYPVLAKAASAISAWVNSKSLSELENDPLFAALLGVDSEFAGNAGVAKLKRIFTNGSGPLLLDALPSDLIQPNGTHSFGKTVPDGDIKFGTSSFVFINSDFLKLASGENVDEDSPLAPLNDEEILSFISLITTLLHEGVHVRAIELGITESEVPTVVDGVPSKGVELGDEFESNFGSIPTFLHSARIAGPSVGTEFKTTNLGNFDLTPKTQRKVNKAKKPATPQRESYRSVRFL